MSRTLAVFARWPAAGRVKTRLLPVLGPDLACDLHRAMLSDTLAAARASRCERRVLCWADAPVDRSGAPVETEGFEPLSQALGDLGARLDAAFATLRVAPDDRVVIVGSDAPEITPALLDAAFDALDRPAMVVAPAYDGGFSLIGFSRAIVRPFEGVAWSTAEALHQTLARAQAIGVDAIALEPLSDVDVAEDLIGLIARLLVRPERAPRTAAMLSEIGLLPAPGRIAGPLAIAPGGVAAVAPRGTT